MLFRSLYRGRHWEWAGKWAARADDVLSWLPARLTGALLWDVKMPETKGPYGGTSAPLVAVSTRSG